MAGETRKKRAYRKQVERHLGAVRGNFVTEIDEKKAKLDAPVSVSAMTPGWAKRSQSWYGFLSKLLKEGFPDSGHEAVTNLFMALPPPSAKVRTLAFLRSILAWPSFKMGLLCRPPSSERCSETMRGCSFFAGGSEVCYFVASVACLFECACFGIRLFAQP